jgi:nucleotide-binding universal stress UspA family protein
MEQTRTSDYPRYASILVSVDLTPEAEARIRLAGLLAKTCSSHLIGVAAEDVPVPLFSGLPGAGEPSAVQLEQGQAFHDLREAAALFRKTASMCKSVEWQQGFEFKRGFATQFVARRARAADLVVVGQQGSSDPNGRQMSVDAATLVLTAGRPVLVVPPGKDNLTAERIVVAWKDTPEARRAVADSLPLLRRAEKVFVVSAGSDAEEQGGEEVSAYLGRHEVRAEVVLKTRPAGTVADELLDIARQRQADLIVCGAYGHSRAHELVFGGVTRDLMRASPVCCLMSH